MSSTNNSFASIEYEGRRWYPIPEIGEDVSYPSVTTVLDDLIRKKAIEQWHANMAAEYTKENLIDKIKSGELTLEDVERMETWQFVKEAKMYHKVKSDEAKDIGLRVHEFCNVLFRRMIDVPGEPLKLSCDKDIVRPCKAVVEWIHKNEVRPVGLELRIWSSDFGGYGGRLDLVSLVNGRLLTVEIKTAKDIYDEYLLQVAAYDYGFEQRNTGRYTDGMAILRLDKEQGFPEFYEYSKEERDDYLKEFGMWCELWHTRNNRKNKNKVEKQKEKERLREIRKTLPKKPRKKAKEDPV